MWFAKLDWVCVSCIEQKLLDVQTILIAMWAFDLTNDGKLLKHAKYGHGNYTLALWLWFNQRPHVSAESRAESWINSPWWLAPGTDVCEIVCIIRVKAPEQFQILPLVHPKRQVHKLWCSGMCRSVAWRIHPSLDPIWNWRLTNATGSIWNWLAGKTSKWEHWTHQEGDGGTYRSGSGTQAKARSADGPSNSKASTGLLSATY